MALRIAGVNLPNDKRIEIALTYIHGIGRSLAKTILLTVEIDPNTKVKDLPEQEANVLREVVEKKHSVEGDLRREVQGNIKRLKEIGSYRGLRHAKHLPARGQRTKTNSRTVRGNKRVTMGSGKSKAGLQKT
ncbi:30S ribosomal protein S13 [Candidatus Falkowbacteria bacterium]|uniref:Small ribosomal subunit protein uS13 n=1 Tax=Candidatus Falkowbacteria bacterium CG10_big_fil_rev_8_21_14_0_10_37_18 TaxID=1974562 RepID=A0A2H0VB08_9BACT|nr:30S ribosomal protein S13 [Candidatus Falkowbacteria bacterium]NCQ12563.1 30S ribosomal protein S13 [Candidatus Falkowbacteria bacterium]OIO06024.1 MAG: 30S ribosomal protein S13 [Candidatus Falkowbacteria bacterium CG1_02_37_21]PIR95549.1 MAG: 30S ribosomal protein S13 [Candidatus Falkowbacteria bacterium CG10_big_fil_rev_8_21_14_0_10_37_18]